MPAPRFNLSFKARWALGLIGACLALAIGLGIVSGWGFAASWLIGVSLVTAGAFWYDKQAAGRQPMGPRVPEQALLLLCSIGGTIGGVAVMLGRGHKTRDGVFRLGIAVIVGVQATLLALWLWKRFG